MALNLLKSLILKKNACRFITKGKAISDYSDYESLLFSDIINNLPRKILNYQTPEQLFEQQLDLIYAT